MDRITKGHLACTIFDVKCLELGFHLYKPLTENTKVDTILEKENVYIRVQVKKIISPKNSKKYMVFRKPSHSLTKHSFYRYTSEDIDFMVGVDIDTHDCYILPIETSCIIRSSKLVKKLGNFKNSFNLLERFISDDKDEQQNIGELVAGKADDNPEA